MPRKPRRGKKWRPGKTGSHRKGGGPQRPPKPPQRGGGGVVAAEHADVPGARAGSPPRSRGKSKQPPSPARNVSPPPRQTRKKQKGKGSTPKQRAATKVPRQKGRGVVGADGRPPLRPRGRRQKNPLGRTPEEQNAYRKRDRHKNRAPLAPQVRSSSRTRPATRPPCLPEADELIVGL